jgi:2-polyprenyl-3-methyl-5-hydroxy-6-metoxy-1,4-benzoquinol methylase
VADGGSHPTLARIGATERGVSFVTEKMTEASPFPSTVESLQASSLLNSWWYYSVELLPDVVVKGQYSPSVPMLPRILMRRSDLRGASCLDLGTMEGLMPVLMSRSGASRVLAIDGVDHCLEKLAAVQHYYGTSFEYRTVGPMYSLSDKLGGEGFDFINCSGLLYHVVSPLTVLTGLRGSLKRNGLIIVSTNVIVDREAFADFNAKGRLQVEPNTFWYLSTGLLDYALRYLRLAPIVCAYQPHDTMETDWRMRTEKRSGYLSVLCRGIDQILPTTDDPWMADSAARSWEYEWLADWERVDSQPVSRIGVRGRRPHERDDLGFTRWQRLTRQVPPVIDLTASVEAGAAITEASGPADSHQLSLGASR